MTKKDYELIAFILSNDRLEVGDNKKIGEIVNQQHYFYATGFANRLSCNNPRFNRAKFLQACGVIE